MKQINEFVTPYTNRLWNVGPHLRDGFADHVILTPLDRPEVACTGSVYSFGGHEDMVSNVQRSLV
jgi:hypothetical protein